ncbi:dephospho-CoA kinase [Shewanella waksmanii]|uniref:dephospho-CoA kinase n=1 Tax=Shewanella waksmanii TaxID=213783 RepID=UPI003734C9FD
MAKLIVGLTGGIGSGKTTVAELFAEKGIELVDADIVAREVVAPGSLGLQKISQHFGENILLSNGELDRKALRDLVFSQPEQRHWLNELLHPMIRSEMLRQLDETCSSYAILVVPLLFENGLDRLVNYTLVVDISPQEQMKRVAARDDVSAEQVQRIIDSQASRSDKLSKADDVIDNHGTQSALIQQVDKLHQKYLQIAENL